MRRAALGFLGLLLAACSEGAPSEATVTASNAIRFEPAEVLIRTGGTVTWRFQDVPHNVFFVSGLEAPAGIPLENTNSSVSRTFPRAGRYDFECRIHPGMTGTVVVMETRY